MSVTGIRLASHLLRQWVMPRTQPTSQPSDPEDYKPERGDERVSSARKLRQDHDDDDKDDDDEDDAYDDDESGDDDDYEAVRTVEQVSAATDRGRDDEDDDEALTEADVMEILDLDDLNKMEGPDT